MHVMEGEQVMKTLLDYLILRDPLKKHRSGMLRLLFYIGFGFIIASCGGGKKSSTPPAAGNAILPSAAKLEPPALIFPSSATHPSNTSSLSITGSCTPGPGAKVYLGGDEDQKTSCSDNGDFSFVVTKANDGVFNYTLREESLIHHPSDSSGLTWRRSTVSPAAPTITNPASYPYFSSGNTFTIAGGCMAGITVNLTGDSTQSATCSDANTYTFSIPQSTDGTFAFELYQTDIYGNQSNNLQISWTRNTAVPSAPIVTVPVNNPYTSSDAIISLDGTCATGTMINLTGSVTDSTPCSSGTFSFDLNEASYGTFNYSLTAVSITNISSAAATFQWIRSPSVPSTPILTSPVTSPLVNNSDNLTIAGSCTDGNTVYLTGSTTNNAVCASSSFTFNVSKTSDSTYNFTVYQQNGQTSSGAVGVTWTRDTLPPLAPIITAPGINPYTSSSTSLLIAGTCDNGTAVNLTGDSTNMVNCTSGSFSFNVNKTTNAIYNFSLSQTDAAGNTSTNSTLQWTLDTAPPSAPTITNPATSPLTSNSSNFTIAGACENSATVYLSGSSIQNVVCASNAYSFTVNKTSDGTFSFSVSQTDLAGLSSSSNSVQWIRDTSAPSAPTITNPATNPLTSNDTNLTISGACETGATVTYSGAASGTTTCNSGAYSLGISKNVDGTYTLSITQNDIANNVSSATSFEWTRLSSIPATPSITSPATSPYYGKLNNLTLTGTCATGNTVQLSGAGSQSTTCAANSFSFSLNQATDGSYSYSIVQINGSSISSSSASFTWVVDTVNPSTPAITNPATASVTNSSSTLTIAGNCEANATIQYSGSASGTTACTGGSTFTFGVNKSADGIYTISISQIDRATNSSGSTSIIWRRDTLAPAAPTVTQPNMNPYTSGDTSLTIGGTCESGATVNLSGATTLTTTCSALNSYSFVTSKTIDGTYNFTITQSDAASNVSAALGFQWARDTSIPFTPVVTSPATTNYYSNGSSVSITVTCQTGLSPQDAIVHLTGVDAANVISPAGTLDQDCITSPVTFVIQESVEGTYNYTFSQENPNNTNSSADTVFNWHRDIAVPSAPTLTSPSENPYTGPGNITLAGGCESNATVNVTGDSTQNVTCSGGTYSFSIVKSTDATYNFSVTQTDLAGNTSTATTLTWTRNSNSLPPPTITNPATNPYADNIPNLVISGDCQPNYTVTLSGNIVGSEVTDPAGSLTQLCTSSGTYSFAVAKTSDSTYNFTVTESFNSATSAATNLAWTRDTTAPTTTISTAASNPNLVTSIPFTFSAPESSTFQCSFNGGAYQSCTSPINYSGLTNAAFTFAVIATDTVGNIGAAASYSWTQASYNGVAIYHLNAGTASALYDSGQFTTTSAFNNNLTSYGSPSSNSSGKLPTSSPKSFNLGTGKYFDVANNASFNSVANKMTIEGMFYFNSLSTTTSQYYTLFSNSGSASPNLGWELRLERQNSGGCTKWKLKFLGSLNGATQSTVPSTSCITVSTGRWYYVAVTWNNGTLNFYMSSSGATPQGSGVIGTAGSSVLSIPNVPFKIGANATSGTGSSLWINGAVDEVRISNTVRTPSYPAAEYTAD